MPCFFSPAKLNAKKIAKDFINDLYRLESTKFSFSLHEETYIQIMNTLLPQLKYECNKATIKKYALIDHKNAIALLEYYIKNNLVEYVRKSIINPNTKMTAYYAHCLNMNPEDMTLIMFEPLPYLHGKVVYFGNNDDPIKILNADDLNILSLSLSRDILQVLKNPDMPNFVSRVMSDSLKDLDAEEQNREAQQRARTDKYVA